MPCVPRFAVPVAAHHGSCRQAAGVPVLGSGDAALPRATWCREEREPTSAVARC